MISCTAIGDTLLSTPAVRATRRLFPHARIDWLVRDRYVDLFRDNPDVDEVIGYLGAYRRLSKLVRHFRERDYDLCLVFHDSDPCPVQAAWLAGVPFILRFGFKDESCARYLSTRVPYRDDAHLIEQRLDVLRVLCKAPLDSLEDSRMVLPLNPKDAALFWRQLKSVHGLDPEGDLLIGFQISAARAYKEWPESHFAALAERILGSFARAKVVLMGGPGDGARAAGIRGRTSDASRVVPLAGKVELKSLPALVGGLDLLVTGDTGPMHVAIALQTPTVSLFVPTNVRHTGPYQDRHLHLVVEKRKPCSPCMGKYCREPFCMAAIEVAEVFEGVKLQFSRFCPEKARASADERPARGDVMATSGSAFKSAGR